MKANWRSFMRAAIAGTLAAAACIALTPPANVQAVSPDEARQIAEYAYVYGYSLI